MIDSNKVFKMKTAIGMLNCEMQMEHHPLERLWHHNLDRIVGVYRMFAEQIINISEA